MPENVVQTYHRRVAELLIKKIQEGTAPWQRPWSAGGEMPRNPATGKEYHGGNAIALMMQGYDDPRWMTYKQATSIGCQVRKGERGTSIIYWKYEDTKVQKAEDGTPVLGEDGNPITQTVRYDRPRQFITHVFNARQIDGLPLYERPQLAWNPVEKAETLLASSGARIEHQNQDKAYYSPRFDKIVLPLREQFSSEQGYYATALHELGHWTGHETRLNRDLAHPFGSEPYAREELIAEMASMMLCDKIGILNKKIDNHAAYVESWIKALRDDPSVLFRSARAAEECAEFVMNLEQKQEIRQTVEAENALEPKLARRGEQHRENTMLDSKREYLAVPFEERALAKAAGALWDGVAKLWYGGPDANQEKLLRWKSGEPRATADPRIDFANAMSSLGCVVTGDHPIMDGKPHRIAEVNDRPGQAACFYVGHLDGVRPAGYIRNNRTGEEMRWKSAVATPVLDLEAVRAQCDARRKEAAEDMRRQHERAAERLATDAETLSAVVEPTAYHTAKGIDVHKGALLGRDGKTLCIPAHDVEGKVWTMHYVGEDGTKRFAKDARKEGCFHVIGGDTQTLSRASAIVISEGYATAATIAESVHYAAVAAFDSGNLERVAKALREAYPDKPIVIAGDDDRHLVPRPGSSVRPNPGRTHAEAAARSVDGIAVFPVFAPGEAGRDFTDFNDLARKSALGAQAVKRQIAPVVEQAVEQAIERQRTRELALKNEQTKGRGISR